MSQHSALASLTAQYTDSEDEEDTEEVPSPQPSVVTKEVSKIGSEGGTDSQQSEEGRGRGGGGGGGLGLVSYHDDLIDDEAVDDMYTTSDSNQTTQEDQEEPRSQVDSPMEGGSQGGTQDTENRQTTNGVDHGDVETIVVEDSDDNSQNPKKKRSLIPPEPPGTCAPELQEKFAKMMEKKIKGGLDMNKWIQRNKNFRNPSIYEKLIKYCDIDELGSNYPKNVFDPHEWHASSYYDELAKAQKDLMEKRERERKDRTKVEFVSGTVKKPTTPAVPEEPKRKSKWDQRGVMPPLLLTSSSSLSQPSVVVVPNPAANAPSASKSTVISAFGNISKKPK